MAAVREGRFSGALWIGPKDEAIAIVGWLPLGPSGVGADLFLTREYRTWGTFGQLLHRVEAFPGPPLLRLEFPGLGGAPARFATLLERSATDTSRDTT